MGQHRVLIYSHDTYGLGHLRRCLLIASRLGTLSQIGSILVVTGSPRTQAFRVPRGCDTVKLPAVTKDRTGRYRARTLGMSLDEVARIRAELVSSASRAFRPDLILVDHAPLGMAGELGPLLEDLRAAPRRPRLVLGLRDVIDDADRVRAEWDRLGAWEVLDHLYDRVLVYGDQAVRTTAQELRLAERLPGKVRLVGYLGRRVPGGNRRRGEPTILVTAGGGNDGQTLLRAYASFLESLPVPAAFRSVVVTGPFLSRRRRRELTVRFRAVPHPVEIVTFTDRFEDLLAEAAGVVSMAGYNTVAEVLSARVPALLVPRERPRLEQRIRAERLEPFADVEACPAGRCEPSRLARFVERALRREPRVSPRVALDGLDRVARELIQLFDQEGSEATEHEGALRETRRDRVRLPA